jgi:hypothetical protein
MTQRCRYDEQVLDYVYGELSAAERAEFERHLSTCSTCPPQVSSFSRVHSEVRGLPRLEPSPEAMQRMTALLMQEAAKVKPAPGANGVSPTDPAAAHGGGKIIEFRPRGLRRILLHPATGVTAVAAAALLFVMFRPPGPDTEVAAPAPAAHPTLTAAPAPAGSVADLTAQKQEGTASPEAVAAAPAAPVAAPEKVAGDTGGGYAATTPAGKARLAERSAEPAWDSGKASTRMPAARDKKKSGDSLDGLLMAESGREVEQKARAFAQPPGAPAPSTGASAGEALRKDAKPMELADKRDARELPPAAEPSFAQPPPPPVAQAPAPTAKTPSRADSSSIGSELAARSRQRSVDDLENQALGQAPSTLDSAQRGRYAAGSGQAGPAYGNKAEETGNAARSAAPTDDEDALPSRNSLGRREPTLADEVPRQLQAVQELLAKGRCAEAHAVINRIEQATPTARGLAEARTQYQLRCTTPNQQQLTPFTPQQAAPSQQAPVLPAPAPAATAPMRPPLEAPSPKPSYRVDRSAASNVEMRAKKAAKPAPAKAKATTDAKAADALY